jgi:hypothetical protein
VKTPKSTKIKLTTKPRDASATKPKETKAKKAKESENAKPEEKPMTDAERRDKQEKSGRLSIHILKFFTDKS